MDANRYILIIISLFIFGLFYNAFTTWMEKTGRDRGATALLVVGGTLVTLIGAWVLYGTELFLALLGLFGASGMPMIVGAWIRFSDERRRDEEAAREMAGSLLGTAVEDDQTHG